MSDSQVSKSVNKMTMGHLKVGEPIFESDSSRAMWAAAVVVSVLLMWAYWCFFQTDVRFFPQDDAYISLQFSRQFFESGKLAYNTGEPSAGLTSPLFVLLCSFFYLFIRDWYWTGVAVGLASHFLLLVVGTDFCRRLFGNLVAIIFALLFVVNGRMLYLSLIGLESVTFAATIMLLAYGFQFWTRPGIGGALLGVAYLCRPDGVFALPAMLVVYAINRQWRRAIIDGLVCLAVISPWIIFCFFQNGTPFPNTVIVKKTHGLVLGDNWPFFKTLLFLSTYDHYYERMVASFVQMSLWETIRQYVPVFGLSLLVFAWSPKKLWLPFATAIVQVTFLKLKHPGVAEWQRYLTLEHSVTILAMAVGLGSLYRYIVSKFNLLVARSAFFIGLTAIGALFLSDLSWHAQARNIISRYFYTLDYHTGLWLSEHAPSNSRVGLYQAGGVKFYSQFYALDFGELMTPQLWEYRQRKAGYQAILDFQLDYIAEFGRDWLTDWGIPDTEDPRFFHPIVDPSYIGRGLVQVDREAIREHLRKENLLGSKAP